uniref:SMB domain-containing protein n=1 Tax=Ascaris lumbricoides TaxID=6252 RepID=A0A0M3I6W6_ASCLU
MMCRAWTATIGYMINNEKEQGTLYGLIFAGNGSRYAHAFKAACYLSEIGNVKLIILGTFNFECSGADMCIDGFCKERVTESAVKTLRHCSFAPWCIPSIHNCKRDWCPLGQICNTASSLCE